jgi:hypothetical protein
MSLGAATTRERKRSVKGGRVQVPDHAQGGMLWRDAPDLVQPFCGTLTEVSFEAVMAVVHR